MGWMVQWRCIAVHPNDKREEADARLLRGQRTDQTGNLFPSLLFVSFIPSTVPSVSHSVGSSAMAAHTQDPIPLVNALADVYSSKDAVLQQGQRWDKLAQTFQQHFNHKPSFIARAPGRVNVIGEHVDHMGFGVLPAAIELDILMAVRVVHDESDAAKGDKISFHLRNTTPRFEPASFESPLSDPQSVELLHSGETRWANYFKVAWKVRP